MKKTIIAINSWSGWSTGNIARQLLNFVSKDYETYFAAGQYTPGSNNKVDFIIQKRRSSILEAKLNSEISGSDGFHCKQETKALIKWLDEKKPDLIHLHNPHGYYLNLPMLINYITAKKIPMIWTLHDCWSFTGRCAHFTKNGCDKWKTGCNHCSFKFQYPRSFLLDEANEFWETKRNMLTNKGIVFVTPSRWLFNLLESSFLSTETKKIINNGVDTSIFKPTSDKERDKKIILGVASSWGGEQGPKGLSFFNRLSQLIDLDRWKIVVVGVTDKDKTAPKIERIGPNVTQQELSKIYSKATVFFNPTLEDNFPSVNLESLACGTPIIAFESGGASEVIREGINGYSVKTGDIDSVVSCLSLIKSDDKSIADCVDSASLFSFDAFLNKYLDLYQKLLNS